MAIERLAAPKHVRCEQGFAASFPGADVLTDADVLMTRREAAGYLRRSIPTLERWAMQGTGPRFRRMNGRVLYQLSDLRRFVAGEGA